MKQYSGYSTDKGKCICGDSLELLSNLEDNSVNLVVTSPPFALQRKKEYGNESQEAYVQWLCQFGKLVYKKLCDDGSFVIDIGGAYEKGQPTYSLYQFKVLIKLCDEVGFYLAQPFYWHNPSALPAPIEWVNKRKIRAKTSVNTVWWLCKKPFPKADIRNVLVPYSKIDIESYTRRVFSMFGGEQKRVGIRFRNYLLDTAIERFGAGKDVFYRPDGKEYFVVTADVEISDQFFAWVCGFRKRAAIINPPDVVEGMKKFLEDIETEYQDKES